MNYSRASGALPHVAGLGTESIVLLKVLDFEELFWEAKNVHDNFVHSAVGITRMSSIPINATTRSVSSGS